MIQIIKVLQSYSPNIIILPIDENTGLGVTADVTL